jgi:hypothetical protein
MKDPTHSAKPPAKLPGRNAMAKRLDEFTWIDADGLPHFELVKFMEALDVEPTPENQAFARKFLEEFLKEQGIEAIHRETPDD